MQYDTIFFNTARWIQTQTSFDAYDEIKFVEYTFRQLWFKNVCGSAVRIVALEESVLMDGKCTFTCALPDNGWRRRPHQSQQNRAIVPPRCIPHFKHHSLECTTAENYKIWLRYTGLACDMNCVFQTVIITVASS